jgi:putative ABC transport system permease protein
MVVLGLTAAFTVFLVVVMQCYYDFAYNGNFKNIDDVYMYLIEDESSGQSEVFSSINSPNEMRHEMQLIQQTYPEIVDLCVIRFRVKDFYCDIIKDDGTEIRYVDQARSNISENFFSFFNPKTMTGDATKFFTEPNRAILTKSYARRFFGNENPVGKVIKYGYLPEEYYSILYTVIAVWEDFPDNCSLKNGIYVSFENNRNDECDAVFVRINKSNKSDLKTLAMRIVRDEHWPKEMQEKFQPQKRIRNGSLIPFDEINFSKIGKSNLVTTLSLLFVGIIALIVAGINFVNFSIAMVPARIKSLNIQKIFGTRNGMLRLVIASELTVFSLFAFLFAIVCVSVLHKNLPGDLFIADLSVIKNWQILLVIGICTVLAGFIIGLYPAYYATSFKPVLTLSGSPMKSKKNVRLRNILTSVQFTASLALIITVVFMKSQHSHAVNYYYNMNTENIVYLSTREWMEGKFYNPELVEVFIEELKKSPQVSDYSTTVHLIGASDGYKQESTFNGAKFDCSVYTVGENFFKMFGIPIIEGTDFNDSILVKEPLIVNKEFVKACGMSVSDIIGKKSNDVHGDDGSPIIGVIEDVNFEDLHYPFRPFIFRYADNVQGKWLLIKLVNRDPKTIAFVKSIWEKITEKPFEYTYLDDYLAGLYKKENDQANLLTIVCIITIIIAVMGVFGLITFNIRQKEKEIALRKISGADIWDILLLLNRGVLIQLLIAFIVATPIAYYITNRWLETFAYRISMHWWVFVLCWLLMCLIVIATIGMQVYRAAMKNPVEAIKNE